MGTLFVALRALMYLAFLVVLWTWLAISVRPLDARLGGPLPAFLAPLGWPLAALGGALALLCMALFVARGRGTLMAFDAPRVFVATGPYRWVRNPMYIGVVLVILGAGLAVRSPAIGLLSAVALAVFHGFVLVWEEPSLASTFDGSYLEYKRRTPRWIPTRPLAGSA
jgi:protein-S-isoprenylcysteine O-methyltransferase Ste14